MKLKGKCSNSTHITVDGLSLFAFVQCRILVECLGQEIVEKKTTKVVLSFRSS